MLSMSVRCVWLKVQFQSRILLLIFPLPGLSGGDTAVLKSPTVTALLALSPFMSVNICCMYLDTPMLGA